MGLKDRGHSIDVITTHHSSNYEKLEMDGVIVHRLPVKYQNKFGFLRRIKSFLSFNRKAVDLISQLPKPDLLYCISTPLTCGLIGMRIKKTLSIPFIFEVGDLWPEAPIQMGVIRSKILKSRLFKLEKNIYEEASGIVALSEDINESISERCQNSNIITIPNMADTDFFSTSKKSERSDELMPGFKFVIGCIGAIGKANHLDYLLETARHFNNEQIDVAFIIMGEGSEKERLRMMGSDLPNVKFLPFSDRNVVKEVLESIDAVYISFKSLSILETGSPNKYFDALAAGKMVITNFGGWIGMEIEKSNCGFTYSPENPSELAEKLAPFISSSHLLDEVSERARALGMKYKKEDLIDKLEDWLTTNSK